jgi:hypothetical protein
MNKFSQKFAKFCFEKIFVFAKMFYSAKILGKFSFKRKFSLRFSFRENFRFHETFPQKLWRSFIKIILFETKNYRFCESFGFRENFGVNFLLRENICIDFREQFCYFVTFRKLFFAESDNIFAKIRTHTVCKKIRSPTKSWTSTVE